MYGHVITNFSKMDRFNQLWGFARVELRSNGFLIACENSRLFSLLAARDVTPGGMSAPQRRKFHTDDVNQYLHNKGPTI